jgi:hypothetical protein
MDGGGAGAGNCDFTGGAVADILLPEKDERVELVEGGERAGDGSCGPGDLPHGMATASFTASTETQDSYALNILGLRLESVIRATFMVLAVKLPTSLMDKRFFAHALELEASEKRFRSVFEGAEIGIAISELADGTITAINPAYL